MFQKFSEQPLQRAPLEDCVYNHVHNILSKFSFQQKLNETYLLVINWYIRVAE